MGLCENAEMHEATRVIRSTLSPPVPGEALHPGPVFATTYHTPGDPADAPYSYARSHNPVWTALEAAISGMESNGVLRAKTRVFGSGMAAIAAVFGAVLRPGDVAVLPSNAYFTARVLMQRYFVEMGITLRMAPTAGGAQGDLLEGARLLWLESPSNPTMEICDIRALSERAHRAGALVAVDNTTATPLGQRPLELGADFSVASDAKLMTGHSDLLVGHVSVHDPELLAKIDSWRTLTGGVLGPMEAWLTLRSIATLPLRLERSCANAQIVAEFLSGRKGVEEVLYPGLATHPGHEIAATQMRYFGPALGFRLRDKAAAERFLAAAQLVTEATSFGGISTTAERRAKWGGDDVPPGFIRMSAGCEAVEDLLKDLDQALEATG